MPDPMLLGMAAGAIVVGGGVLAWVFFTPIRLIGEWRHSHRPDRCRGVLSLPDGYRRCGATPYEDGRCPGAVGLPPGETHLDEPPPGRHVRMSVWHRYEVIGFIAWLLLGLPAAVGILWLMVNALGA